ncbi:MAG TPA: glycosyltransferase family 1 protein [Deltaproteobacteria bacterium]|nr:glycosyltransferase family 1 protein [Deltaproteobacteria bacterium]
MRILVASSDFPLRDGGVATVAFEVARALDALGHDVTVLAPTQEHGDGEFDAALPFRVIRTRNVKDHYAKLLYQRLVVKRLAGREHFDWVAAQTWYPFGAAAAGVMGGMAKRPVLTVTVHGNEILNPRFRSPFWRRRMKRTFETADAIFCVSSATARKLHEVTDGLCRVEEKVRIVGNGVDIETFKPAPPKEELLRRYGLEGRPVLLTLARLVERKGQDTVIRALPAIKKAVPGVRYLICGKGDYEGELKKLAAETGVAGDVVFAGFVPNEQRPDHYNLCDVYVMASREIERRGDVEGFGITYLEAGACAKPVVAGRSGGTADAVVDGETGLLADPEDPADVADKCIRLLGDRATARAMGGKARETAAGRYRWAEICETMAAAAAEHAAGPSRP